VVGEKAPRSGPTPWSLTLCGAVESPLTFSLTELAALGTVERAIDIHCVTRWSRPAMLFRGVPLPVLLAHAIPTESARFVWMEARSERNHGTSLPLASVIDLCPLLVTHADGRPLPTENGGPLRIVCPGKYFYKSLKWVEKIELLPDDRLGYWESTAGYHNGADPWKEERYVAPTVPPKLLEFALRERTFRGLDLRGADLRGRDLTGLRASGALLRDVHFEGAILKDADFTGANLSNAHFESADCTEARFTHADCEGAAFDGAKLDGADFTGASLFGATFESAGNL
jgi:hypothetical protein